MDGRKVPAKEPSSLSGITLFTSAKPFEGHIATIQNNALQSWSLFESACEVILFGCDPGTAEAAARFNFRHVPEVACNEYGTPLISDLFAQAQSLARTSLVCYVNADIILMSDFLATVGKLDRFSSEFLMVGRRWDVDIREAWDFAAPGWEGDLRRFVREDGKLHGPTGIDYFLFPRGMYTDLPPFAIGRLAWDNWLIYQARALGATVVDATPTVMVVHQNHGYMPDTVEKVRSGWKIGPEARRNMALAGRGGSGFFNVSEATWVIDQTGLRRRPLTPAYLAQRLTVFSIRHLGLRPLFRLAWRTWGWLRSRPLAWFGKSAAIT